MGYDKWVEFLNVCMDNKINQFNMVMYGYWPFEFEKYPETVYRNVPVDIWNAENDDWLTIRYTHPNIEHPYLTKLFDLGHMMEFSFFAYVGLNSYNGAYSIKHPEARMIPPKGGQFLNDFDSLCLSNEDNVNYILDSMQRIAEIGFDGFTLEESEEDSGSASAMAAEPAGVKQVKPRWKRSIKQTSGCSTRSGIR